MIIASSSKQQEIHSTSTDHTPWEYELRAVGNYEEIRFVEGLINNALREVSDEGDSE